MNIMENRTFVVDSETHNIWDRDTLKCWSMGGLVASPIEESAPIGYLPITRRITKPTYSFGKFAIPLHPMGTPTPILDYMDIIYQYQNQDEIWSGWI